MKTLPLLITPGEPAGIGPDITIQLCQRDWSPPLVIVADPALLAERAKQLRLPLMIQECHPSDDIPSHQAGTAYVLPVSLTTNVTAGTLNTANATYVINTLQLATDLCLQNQAAGIVTGPVHKAILNEAGIAFSGHTEFFAKAAQVKKTVMLFVAKEMKVALATTHLPLNAVSQALTASLLEDVIRVLHQGLQQTFALALPRITVCGLNPHAGENGHLGREEIDVITPVITKLKQQGLQLEGPLPADTAFTEKPLAACDAILAMYHDQALPLVKYLGFGKAVNVTLGLPFLRTSVDHGTALDLAGSGKANAGSLVAAVDLAIRIGNRRANELRG